MAELFKNLASTTLDDAIDDSTTTIAVASAMGFAGGNFRILINSEIMKVTGVSGTTFTVARGQEGTQATAHSSGADVHHVLTAGALDAHDQDDLAVCDTYANKPAAGVPGRIFVPTDGIFIERDNGTAWEKFGPIWPMTPPAAADFTVWLNQGTSTFADNKGAIFFEGQVSTSTLIRAKLKAYPATPFTLEVAFIPNCIPYGCSSEPAVGLCIRDSVSGKMEIFGPGGSSYGIEIYGSDYASATSSGSTLTGWTTDRRWSKSPLIWLKYADNATNRIISTSVDGHTWTQLASLSSTYYLTPDQIGFSIKANCGYSSTSPYFSINTGVTILHWRQY